MTAPLKPLRDQRLLFTVLRAFPGPEQGELPLEGGNRIIEGGKQLPQGGKRVLPDLLSDLAARLPQHRQRLGEAKYAHC